ncbi:MAG: hypothetical protein BWY67_01451 [Bacteroidetes bacterium ADurb.Bin397]|nr:MAG: hypothetical protein BWY67_01451 [Bacteroidetes bacterium ADurb.Bin397]
MKMLLQLPVSKQNYSGGVQVPVAARLKVHLALILTVQQQVIPITH